MNVLLTMKEEGKLNKNQDHGLVLVLVWVVFLGPERRRQIKPEPEPNRDSGSVIMDFMGYHHGVREISCFFMILVFSHVFHVFA